MISVFLVVVIGSGAIASDFEEVGGGGIPFAYQAEYAPTYHDYKPRDYHFNYAVSDPHTGDHKSQWEVKENGVVRGGYSLLEPDGTTRVVEYIADDHGFRAVVKKIGTAYHDQPLHGVQPIHPVQPIQTVQHLPEIQVTPAPLPKVVIPQEEHLKVVIPEQHQLEIPEHQLVIPQEHHLQVPIEEAPVLKEVIQEEPLYQTFNAYDGNIHNYSPWAVQPQPQPQEYALPEYKPQLVQQVYQPTQPHVKVEYHGFTGNINDDSDYTKYDDGDNIGRTSYYPNEDIAESRPRAFALPINYAYNPIPYQYAVKHISGY